MLASFGVFWFKHSPSPQPQWLPSPASGSSQANNSSSILGFSSATTCRQPLVDNSQAFIMPSAPRSGSGQLGVSGSFLGRVHVAKQVLAALLWYHASFQRPSEQLLRQLSQQLRKFVASAQQASHSDDAVSLAQDCSQGSAHLPSAGPRVAQFPWELTSSLPLSLQLQQPQLLASELYSVLLALPPAWRTIACQLNPNIHLVSNSFGLRHTTHLRCSDRPAPHDWRPSATSADPTRACLLSQPCPSHLLGPL